MGLFSKKKPSVEARSRLFDPDFACANLPGVVGLHIDYDPTVWVRIPDDVGRRSGWAEEIRRAFIADVGLVVGSPVDDKIHKITELIDGDHAKTAELSARVAV